MKFIVLLIALLGVSSLQASEVYGPEPLVELLGSVGQDSIVQEKLIGSQSLVYSLEYVELKGVDGRVIKVLKGYHVDDSWL